MDKHKLTKGVLRKQFNINKVESEQTSPLQQTLETLYGVVNEFKIQSLSLSASLNVLSDDLYRYTEDEELPVPFIFDEVWFDLDKRLLKCKISFCRGSMSNIVVTKDNKWSLHLDVGLNVNSITLENKRRWIRYNCLISNLLSLGIVYNITKGEAYIMSGEIKCTLTQEDILNISELFVKQTEFVKYVNNNLDKVFKCGLEQWFGIRSQE